MDEVTKENFPSQKYIGIFVEDDIRTFKTPNTLLKTLQKVLAFANENKIPISGHHVAIYETRGDSLNFRLFVGFPTLGEVIIVNSEYTVLEIEESKAITTVCKGDYSELPSTHKKMHDAIVNAGVYINKYIIEEYVWYTTTEADPDKWETKISYLTATTKPTRDGKKTKKKASILILEDESMLSDALSMFLVEYGFDVTVAKNGNDAEDIVKARSFDFALLDLLVPGASGFEIFKQLRKKQTNMPIFILSNLEETENKRKALELGANKYFVKSDTLLSDVAREISELLNK